MKPTKLSKELRQPCKCRPLAKDRHCTARRPWFSFLCAGACALITCDARAQVLPPAFASAFGEAPSDVLATGGRIRYSLPIPQPYYSAFGSVLAGKDSDGWVYAPQIVPFTTLADAPGFGAGTIAACSGFSPYVEAWINATGGDPADYQNTSNAYSAEVNELIYFKIVGPANAVVATVDFAGSIQTQFASEEPTQTNNDAYSGGEAYAAIVNLERSGRAIPFPDRQRRRELSFFLFGPADDQHGLRRRSLCDRLGRH